MVELYVNLAIKKQRRGEAKKDKDNFIYDADIQRELTRKILENEPDRWTLWYNCSKKIGLNTYLSEVPK